MPIKNEISPFVSSYDQFVLPFVWNSNPFVIKNKNYGFTLIEMVVAMVIAAILFTMAIPSMKNFVASTRLTTQTNNLLSDISTARNRATTLPARVIICTSSTGTTCDGSGWSSGRLMYWETQPYGTGPAADRSNIIRYTEALPPSTQAFAPTTFPSPLIFDSSGRPIDAFGSPLSASTAMPIIVTLCDTDKKVIGRQITVNPSGQSSSIPYTCP